MKWGSRRTLACCEAVHGVPGDLKHSSHPAVIAQSPIRAERLLGFDAFWLMDDWGSTKEAIGDCNTLFRESVKTLLRGLQGSHAILFTFSFILIIADGIFRFSTASKIARNNSRGIATSAIWKINCRECRTTFAPLPTLRLLLKVVVLDYRRVRGTAHWTGQQRRNLPQRHIIGRQAEKLKP
jgi:hypothetical protein